MIDPQVNAEGIHVWSFDRRCPVEVQFLSFHPRHQIRANRHDYFEVVYTCQGERIMRVQDRLIPSRKGELFVIGSRLMHQVARFPARKPVKAVVLYFLPDFIRTGDNTGEDTRYLAPFLIQDENFPHVVPADTGIPARVLELLQQIADELPARSDLARLSVKTHLKMILIILAKHYSHYGASTDVYQRQEAALKRVRPLFEFIDQNYASPISVRRAAGVLHMSEASFMRLFRKVTGEPFVTYLNRFRVAKAQVLLNNADLSIAEVASSVGFCDQSYFGLLFRRLIGLTPRQYRQDFRKPGAPA